MKEQQKKKPAGNNVIQIVLTVLLVGAAFAIGSMWTELKFIKGGNKAPAANTQPDQPQAAAPEPEKGQPLSGDLWQEILKDPAYAEGSPDAKVTLAEFSDYQCPFCKRHFDETAGQIASNYIKTGKVRWVVRDLPLSFHQNAHAAAQAARCAGDQDKYKAMHDKLFQTQAAWSEAADPKTLFAGYARELGLNTADFDACYSSGKHKAAVDGDLALAAKAGASGTPTFFINGTPLIGAQPFSAFKTAIEAALNK